MKFHPLTITEIRHETADAISLKFDLPAELESVFAFRAGQHLTLRTELAGLEIRRNYSLCAAPHEGELRIAVKQLLGGAFSTWANTTLRRGATLDVMPATGHFGWAFDKSSPHDYVGIAAGSGITPILSLLKTALVDEPKSRFSLLYANRTSSGIMFLEDLAALKNRFLDRLEIFHFLSGEADEIDLFNGRLDAAKYDQIFPALIDPGRIDAFFICGPAGMMDTAETSLLRHNVDHTKILLERFTTGEPDPARIAAIAALAEQAVGLQFTAILEGRRRTITFKPETKNLLDSARAAGLSAPYACKAGVCATCRARLVCGQVAMANQHGLTDVERAQNYILTCQAVPISPGVVIDYDG